MPHRTRHAKVELHHRRRLSEVEEEPEWEDDDKQHQGTSHPGLCFLRDNAAAGKHGGQKKETKTPPDQSPAMESNYGKIELSPLPLQRALLTSAVARKCAPSTPVPSWKMYDSPFEGAMEAANPSFLMRGVPARQSRCPQNCVSARKLAASLWEMHGAFSSHRHQQCGEKLKSRNCAVGPLKEPKHGRNGDEMNHQSQAGGLPREHCQEGKEGLSEHVLSGGSRQHPQGSPSDLHKHRYSPARDSHPHTSDAPAPHEVEVADGSSPAGKVSPFMNVEVGQSRGEEGSTLCRELVKLLNQVWLLEEQHRESSSIVASLNAELRKTKASIVELQVEQRSYKKDMVSLNKKLVDEKKMLQDRAEEAVFVAINPLKEELEAERKSKLKLESKHKNLTKEVNEVRKKLTKTMQEFEREQKARELMEDVCDELAREIGEDKAQVEELKRQSAKYREEVEQERRMLQMAEVWREERVHMKLAEARFELEEKNTALDKLRSELEYFLKVKRSLDDGDNGDLSNPASTAEEAGALALHFSNEHIQGDKHPDKNVMAPVDAFVDEKGSRHVDGRGEVEDSPDDDLHSIELNRVSYSGSYEGPLLASGNSVDAKAIQNGKPSLPSEDGETDWKQSNLSNLKSDKLMSTSGQLAVLGSTSDKREVDLQVIGKGQERHDSSEVERPKGKGRSVPGQVDSLFRSASQGKGAGSDMSSWDLYADGINSQVELRQHNPESRISDGLFLPKQAATLPSSPSHKWAHQWVPPDSVNPSKSSQPVGALPKAFKDNSLKARLLEAKLESQQARLKESNVASSS